METERTKNRRELREKRLAYFEKVGLAPNQQPHPPKESHPVSRSPVTEPNESVKSQTGRRGNTSARKSVNKTRDSSKGTINGHVSPLIVSSSPRRVRGAARQGDVTPKRGGQQVLYQANNLEPGARPKVRSQSCVNGESWRNSNHVDRRKRSDVNRNNVLRSTFDMNEKPVTRGQRSAEDEDSDKYESSTWSRLEAGRQDDALLAPVSVPMVIPAEHGLFMMGTKEQPQKQTREDDLQEVFRLERRYDYPRGRDLGRLSYEDAQKAAVEHNAFGVDSMLNEMRQVRRVKSQLHEELRESFDTFGCVAGILGKGSIGGGEKRNESVQSGDDNIEKGGYQNNFEGNFRETEMDAEGSAIGRHEGFENNHSRKIESGQWSLEMQDGSPENQSGGDLKSLCKNESVIGNRDCGTDTIDESQSEDVNMRRESYVGQTEERISADVNMNIVKEQGYGHHGDKSKRVYGNHGDDIQEEQEDGEFNLGALCAAAKQGDDILKDYIKRLTQKILKKDTDAGANKGPVNRSKVREDVQGNGQGLKEKLTGINNHKQHEELANSHYDQDRLFISSRLVNGYDHTMEDRGCVGKVRNPVYSSDQLKQWGYCNGSIGDGDTQVEDVLSNDSESSSGHENHSHKWVTSQSPDVSHWEGELGFETHRPSDRAYSPLKVVRFSGDGEKDERFAKREEGRDVYLQNGYGEGYSSSSGEKELDDIGEMGELNVLGKMNLGEFHLKEQSLSFQEIDEDGRKEELSHGEVSQKFSVSDVDSGDTGNAFDFFRDVKPKMNSTDGLDLSSSQTGQTEPFDEARRKFKSVRRPRTPEEHKKGVERHHQRERQKERLEEVLLEEYDGQNQEGMQVHDLRLSLGSVNTSTEIDHNTFFTEIPSGNMQVSSNMHSHDQFAYAFERGGANEREGDDEDDESMVMEKISQFHPAVSIDEGEHVSRGSRGMDIGCHGNSNGYHSSRNDPPASQPELFHCRREDDTFHPQASLPLSADFSNLSVNPTMSNSHDLSLTSGAGSGDTVMRKDGRGPVKTKSQGSRPKSASQLKTSTPSQYKSRWPQSSNLVPSRPKKANQRISSPETKLDKKPRPVSAKVSWEPSDRGSKGQRSRPKSAIQKNLSVEPGASGDFFSVKSSKMFDGGITRASSTGPLTLKLILDSPRERQHHSIWQLLPDEILLRIFSHLKHSDLVSCAQVCQGFYRVAMDDSLWRFIHLEKKRLSDYLLTQIGIKHPTSVVFLQCEGKSVTENGLRNLFRTCLDSLQELNVSGCSGEMFSGDSVLLHASRCYNLSSIDASWCNVTDNGLNAVSGGCNRLSSVCLNGCQGVTDAGLRSLIEKHGPNLIILEVFGCIDLSPLTLQRIGDVCKNLHSLNIGQCYKVTDESVYEVMPKLKTLRHLDVRGCKQIRDDCVRRIARSCKRLETLVLANCTFVSNVSMVEIAASLKSIRSLDVSGCKKITSEGVRSVAMCCTKMRALNLSSTSIDRKSISTLASYCSISLRELKLNCCKDITEASIIKLLKHCKRLETLHLYGVKGLRNLGLLKLQYPCLMFE